MKTTEKIAALRAAMAERGIHGYLIMSGDAHATEYVADFWRGREWISGFTGSCGLVVVTPTEAGLWTDGRYFIQAEKELAGSGIKLFKMEEPGVPTYQKYLQDNLPDGGKLGFDGRTVTATSFKSIKKFLDSKNITYEYDDLVGMIWQDRPPLPTGKAFSHPIEFAGKTSAEKLAEVRAKMKEQKIPAYLVTALDSIAWLLNIRGDDIKSLPVIYAYALITESEAFVFVNGAKVTDVDLRGFTLYDYDALPMFLKTFDIKNIYYNPNTTNVLLSAENQNTVKPEADIITLLKAVKTPHELKNIRNAYIKDGVVMVKMLHWLENAGVGTASPPITEGMIADVLQKFRREQKHYLCDSFNTISAYGANAALSHYNCDGAGEELRPEGFYLIDTGGQYLDGTTDTTRTIPLGKITDEMKRNYTLVLKGNIALSRAVFLKGTTGSALDILARMPLMESGKNYRHGTGHGLGYCLGVHEGPHNIANKYNPVELAPGMIISNEPAAYKEGHYGIRIENIIAVKEKEKTADGVFLEFETLTHCPINKEAIATELLTQIERDWLNAYHKRTYETLSPHLTNAENDWLKKATEVI
ncbi:MAG: aminopeptidase P family protein [Defluviitaleaceae bacterium]|nr:aminopeptidase P family protein [Defluviitaleaceae bacterium]